MYRSKVCNGTKAKKNLSRADVIDKVERLKKSVLTDARAQKEYWTYGVRVHYGRGGHINKIESIPLNGGVRGGWIGDMAFEEFDPNDFEYRPIKGKIVKDSVAMKLREILELNKERAGQLIITVDYRGKVTGFISA